MYYRANRAKVVAIKKPRHSITLKRSCYNDVNFKFDYIYYKDINPLLRGFINVIRPAKVERMIL